LWLEPAAGCAGLFPQGLTGSGRWLARARIPARNTAGQTLFILDQAIAVVAKDRKCSTSYIQRKLGIGYNKAAKLVEQMEEQGVVTRANHVGKREILVEER